MRLRALLPSIVASMCAFAPSALAQECSSDADCPAGYTCASYVQACPDCPPDTPCEPCDSTTVSVCEIVPTTCSTDADCDEGLVCVHFVGESCPGMAPCPADDPSCNPGDMPPCEAVDESYCAPPYVAACTEDADCGPGFTCQSSEVCTCVAYPDPGNGEPPPPEDCTCEPSGDNYCSLTWQSCASDADCPEGLVCTEGGGADAAPCYIDENGNESCPGSNPEPFCAPPGYVTPLPLEGGGVSAERTDDGSGDGAEGEGEADDNVIHLCASRQVGGSTPWGALVALAALLLRMARAGARSSHRSQR